MVDDPNLQAVFRMRRSEEWTPEDTAHRSGGLPMAQPEPWEKFCDSNCVWTDHHPDCKLAEQEPVAWRIRCTDPMRDWVLMYRYPKTEEQFSNMEIQSLYTTPPQRKPLTEEKFKHMLELFVIPPHHVEMVVRAIEAAHGIKGEA